MQESSPAFQPVPTAAPTRLHFPEHERVTCPRCKSTNIEFCYFNNHNLLQPRHFCKSCERYWTKGGSLRNIPIGGSTLKPAKKINPAKKPGPSPDPKPDWQLAKGLRRFKACGRIGSGRRGQIGGTVRFL